MNEQPTEPEPVQPQSNAQANKVLRILKGERLKYTITIHMKSGSMYELQSATLPKVQFNSETRKDVVRLDLPGYCDYPVTEMDNVELIHVEENVK